MTNLGPKYTTVASSVDSDPAVVTVAVLQEGGEGVNEIQRVTVTYTGRGYFSLEFIGSPSAQISCSASADDVETALYECGLGGEISVTGSSGGPWDVEFINDWAEKDVPTLVALTHFAWDNPTNAQGEWSESDCTETTAASCFGSDWLKLTNFDFSELPPTALIGEVTLEIFMYQSQSSYDDYCTINVLDAAGSPITEIFDTDATYGTHTFLLIETYSSPITAELLRNTNFGIRAQAKCTVPSGHNYVAIYGARMTVAYTVPEGEEESALFMGMCF